MLIATNSKECLRPLPEPQAPKPARADISVGQNQPARLSGYLRGNALTFLRIKSAGKICFFPCPVKILAFWVAPKNQAAPFYCPVSQDKHSQPSPNQHVWGEAEVPAGARCALIGGLRCALPST